MTPSNGLSLGTIKYYPYGETRSGFVLTDKQFTGQRSVLSVAEGLDATGPYQCNARYYDPEIGRFISPDTIIPDPLNPQAFNRYSYCLNNPLKYIDPSGHVVEIGGVNVTLVEAAMQEPDYMYYIADAPDLLVDIVEAADSVLYQAWDTLSGVAESVTDYLEGSENIYNIEFAGSDINS